MLLSSPVVFFLPIDRSDQIEVGVNVRSTMGLSWHFLNLIMDSHMPSIRSLRRIDLKSLQLFYPMMPPPTRLATMETFGLPSPNPNFQACSVDVVHQYSIAQRKVLCTDQCGRNFLYDARR
jgi:hypothetical protein